ncbi:neurogenic locus notch homolog protein 2-like, partial [Stylophora pistillata]|uniref:neurogenic locus notch homolog protein 2-like n=1 Tax=Stylophora pistillata TaxID=50429 RepID=UPI000C051A79
MKKSNFVFVWCFVIFVSVSPQEAVIIEPDDIPETSSKISRQSLLSLEKFHHLNVPNIEEIMVYDDFECTFKCLHHPLCVSVNLAAEGQLWCELLSTDKYRSPNEYKENKNSHHYYFESACADNPCEKNGTCQSGFTDKGHRCLCPTGFKGPNCKKDIDECATETHSCNANAVCSNTKGSYKCSCKPGYFGDGKICTMLSTCKEIYERNKLNKSGKVVLLLDSKPISVFCHMGDFGCG